MTEVEEAHYRALDAAGKEVHFASHARGAVTAYLKEMAYAGYELSKSYRLSEVDALRIENTRLRQELDYLQNRRAAE